MSDDLVKQAIAELQDVVRCRCHPAFTDRGLHDPDCECDSADAVKVVSDRIKELEAENARLREALEKALERIEASAFTNAEHAQAAGIIRAALLDKGSE